MNKVNKVVTQSVKLAATSAVEKVVSFHSNQGLQHNGLRYLREKQQARKQEQEQEYSK